VFDASEGDLTWTLTTPYVDNSAVLTFNKDTTPCSIILPTPVNLVAQITPIVECVAVNEDDTFTARFGYDNLFVTTKAKELAKNVPLLAIKDISDNFIEPAELSQSQTTYFRPGRQTNTFFVVGDLPITWSIRGTDGEVRVAIADLDSTPCSPPIKFAADIIPQLNCINKNEDGTFTARFGYINNNLNGIATINVGANNTFLPAGVTTKQINKFSPGVHSLVFFVVFTPDQLPGSWTLTGPNGVSTTLTITENGPQTCPVL